MSGDEASNPEGSAAADWASEEEGKFEQLEQANEADAAKERPLAEGANHPHRPIKHMEHVEAEQRVEMDQMEDSFERQIEGEISTGQIAVPAGGPLTPEEIHEVEMNPWPGHTMEEAVARLRSQRSAGSSAPPGDDSAAG